MSTSTPTLTTAKIEDYLLAITPLVTALAGFQWGGLIPGATGFLVGVFIGAFSKFLIGFAQNPHPSNWEDLVPLIVVSLAFIGSALSANPQYLEYGTIIGFVVKALGYFSPGGTSTLVEDAFLVVGGFLALYGAYIGNQETVNAGLLLGVVGKAVPGIGGATKPSSSTPAPAAATPPAA